MLPLSPVRLYAIHSTIFAVALCAPPSLPCSAEVPDEQQVSKPVEKNGLSLTIRLDKREYSAGEQIKLYFTLKNESNATIFIGNGNLAPEYHEVGPGRHFELHITAGEAKRLTFWSGIVTEGGAAGVRKVFKIPTGKEYTGVITIHRKLDPSLPDFDRGGTFVDAASRAAHVPGKDGRYYSVVLRYQVHPRSHGVRMPPADFSDDLLWKGAIDSAALNFQVLPE